MVKVWDVFQIREMHTAFYKKLERDFFYTGESHDFWEMVFVVAGEIGITSGSDVFLMKKGQAIIHAPMDFHSLWSEGETEPEIIIFSFSAMNVPGYSLKLFSFIRVLLAIVCIKRIRNLI